MKFINDSFLYSNFQTALQKVDAIYAKKFNEPFPECIRKILSIAGIDSIGSLTNITHVNAGQSTITDIERYINDHKENMTSMFDDVTCCNEYKNMLQNAQRFEILPGHKAIILNIPSLLESNKTEQKTKKISRKNTKSDVKSNVAIRQQLLNALMKYHSKTARELNITTADNIVNDVNIINFKACDGHVDGQDDSSCDISRSYSCNFVCPYCPTTLSVRYKRFWMTSNIKRHIKRHLTDGNRE